MSCICLVLLFAETRVRGKLSNHLCPSVDVAQLISGTANWIFMKFCMELQNNKRNFRTEPDF